ncbi:hypothetical protein [Cognatiluteimonas profundi]|uniref:hypothetical protein n=1 Tax=Cognatiluteimonas profundi TaxID=2594501 RepID=UPI00131E5FBD|nr:hypothetical protein [Lysobacter profundi]
MLSSVNLARLHLARYARATDTPEPGMVDAADLLDAAADCLASTVVSHGIARVREAEA